jgi:hypothetical protein
MNLPIELVREKYKVLADEVKKFVTTNAAILEETGLYKGTQILFSELMHKPKFLFIGINPGPGRFNKYGKDAENFEDFEEQKDFIYSGGGFTLANETESLFKEAGCYDLYDNYSVKTNWVFLATKNTRELDALLSRMLNYKINLYTMSDTWLQNIVEIIEPEIIICEGKGVFKRVTEHVLNCLPKWERSYGYAITAQNIPILGYERNAFGQILDKELVAAKIKKIVVENNSTTQ